MFFLETINPGIDVIIKKNIFAQILAKIRHFSHQTLPFYEKIRSQDLFFKKNANLFVGFEPAIFRS
jgi:hypothetical protein